MNKKRFFLYLALVALGVIMVAVSQKIAPEIPVPHAENIAIPAPIDAEMLKTENVREGTFKIEITLEELLEKSKTATARVMVVIPNGVQYQGVWGGVGRLLTIGCHAITPERIITLHCQWKK